MTSAEQIKVLRELRQGAAAALLGISERKLRSAGPPRNPDGSYDAAKLVAWWIKRKVAQVVPTKGDALERFREEKVRQAKRENDVAEKKLVNAVEIGQMWTLSQTALRNGLLSLQGEFGKEIFERLDFWLTQADAMWKREWEIKYGSEG